MSLLTRNRRVFTVLALAAGALAGPAHGQLAQAWLDFAQNPDAHPNIPNVMYSGYKGGGVALPNDSGRQIVAVTAYGATGDGVTDDTAAVRAALAFARTVEPSASVGVTVYFPPGVYKLSGPLLVHSDRTILRGSGRDLTTLLFTESLESSYADFDLGGGDSGWSFNGGMVWFTDDSRNDYFAGVPTISDVGDGWRTGSPTTAVTQPAVRGDRTITVASGNSFNPGDTVLVQIDNAADYSTLEHLFGDGLWAGAYPFSLANDAKILPEGGRSVFRCVHTVLSRTANTITFREPLRFDLRPEWDPEIRTPRDLRRDVGVASMTIQMQRDYEWSVEGGYHNAEPGFNGVCFSDTVDGFATDLDIIDPGGLAVMLSYSANITVSDVVIDSTGPDRVRHHHGFEVSNAYNSLIDSFEIRSLPYHGATVANTSMGVVYSRGLMDGGTFDYHRILPYENVYTEISLTNSGVASGSTNSGPRTGARATHWNVDTRATGGRIVNQPDILPKGSLVGVRCSATLQPFSDVAGDPEVLYESTGLNASPVDPPNLYFAQLALRDGNPVEEVGGAGFTPCACVDEEPYVFAFGGAVGDPLVGQDGWRFGRDFNAGNGLAIELGVENGHPAGPLNAAVSVTGQDSIVSRQTDGSFWFTPFTHDQTDAAVSFDARAGLGSSSGNAYLILNNYEGFDEGLQFGMSNSAFLIRANRFGSALNLSASIPSGWYTRGEWARLELRIDFTANAGDGAASLYFMNLTDGDTGFTAVPGMQNVPLSSEVRYPESWDHIELRLRNASAATNVVANVGTIGTPCFSPCSPADLDGDGHLTPDDVFLFLTLFDQADPSTDRDGDTEFTFFDVLAYLRDFDEGC